MRAVARAAAAVGARLVGPGATAAEYAVVLAAALGGAAVAAAVAAAAGTGAVPSAVVAVVAADTVGGAAANATRAAKRHWHRPGRTAVHHLAFVAAHAVQPAALAVLVPGFGWAAAAASYGLALAGAAAVLAAPGPVRRPVAFGAVCLGTVAAAPLAAGALAWFVPVFLVKLLPAHLLGEAES
ncbi:hypothetical protein [Nocardiopsis suaedae]|uniref:Uncharacterized protein n=1 Tax=Nocardiopsis suaedae TaxID=3018444 RepID=A0ABT4TFM9_9ACTN|nr:hypothetical protein [Nocardiopsis suaedae]MDA2803513.1 hypothetical protein [Nocardiopsis suaedae]